MILVQEIRQAGFFSDFLMIVGALDYFQRHECTDFYIRWNNYRYQDDSVNLFDRYFYKQPEPEGAFHVIFSASDLCHGLYTPDVDIPLCLRLSNVLKHTGYFENPIYKKCLERAVKAPKTLGVHIRKTDHFMHGELLSDEYYLSEVDKKLPNYDSLFLSTDDQSVVEKFRSIYGDRLLVNDVFRSTTGVAIHHTKVSDQSRLAEDVMTDALSLSQCDEVLITASNVAGYCLMMNPAIKYHKIDQHIEYH